MLAFTYRFHGHGSLRYVYKNGEAIRTRLFTVKYVTNPRRKHPRMAVVVSKKVYKSAVGRNRIRRRVYEILRRALPSITTGCDVVVIISSGEVRALAHSELERQVLEALSTSGLYRPRGA